MIRLVRKRRIDKAYEKMYILAEKLAAHDSDHYDSDVYTKYQFGNIKGNIGVKYFRNMIKYRRERLDYHLNKMIELLKEELNKNDK